MKEIHVNRNMSKKTQIKKKVALVGLLRENPPLVQWIIDMVHCREYNIITYSLFMYLSECTNNVG